MKKILISLFLFFFSITVHAEEFNQIIFFGDSLSDNGNLYHLLLEVLPKSPPYYQGRFSNGPTWAEEVSRYYYNKFYIPSKIYAVGGATADFHLPNSKFVTLTTLESEINKYLIQSGFKNRSKTLFVLWIGGNDYLFYNDEEKEALTKRVIAKISWALNTLNFYGAKHFLILNLPDLSRVPKFQEDLEAMANLKVLSLLHNLKLENLLKDFQQTHSDVQLVSVNILEIFNDILDHPGKYNKKYHLNITNTKNSCWTGDFVLKNSQRTEELNDGIKQLFFHQSSQLTDGMDLNAIQDFIKKSRPIYYIYSLGESLKRGNLPCPNADEYVFWDGVHPTAIMHQLLSRYIIERMTEKA